jgi:hypothetical protein
MSDTRERIYCEDCRFYVPPMTANDFGGAKCSRSRAPQPVELVARAAAKPMAFCDMQRSAALVETCGPDAKFFEHDQIAEAAE